MTFNSKLKFSLIIVCAISLLLIQLARFRISEPPYYQEINTHLQALEKTEEHSKELVLQAYQELLHDFERLNSNKAHMKEYALAEYALATALMLMLFDFLIVLEKSVGTLQRNSNKQRTQETNRNNELDQDNPRAFTFKHQQQIILRTSDEERVLTHLLKFSFEPLDIFLHRTLQEIIAQSWLHLQDQGGIFLHDEQSNQQKLTPSCTLHLSTEMIDSYSQLLFVEYFCVDTDTGQKNQNVSAANISSKPIFHDQAKQNHYLIPILHGNDLLGFMLLFLATDCQQQQDDFSFFCRVADIMSIGIARKLAEQQVEYLAYHDALTKLPNRLLLLDRLEQVIALDHRQNRYSALIYIDLDRFKNIIDSLGHPVGEAVLIEVADRLKRLIRHEDTLARLGDNEFVTLITDIIAVPETAVREIQKIVQKLQHAIAKEFHILGQTLYLSFSAGVVLITHAAISPDMLLKQAHTAMFQAKTKGCGSISFFVPEMQAMANTRLEMEKDLRHALSTHELTVHYQPQVDHCGTIIAAEALLRWHHPTKGHISPDQFIPVAEDSGLILSVGSWVFEQVCLQVIAWQHIVQLQHIAVNVSPVQFRHTDFVQTIKAIISKTEVDPNKLLFELTEGILVENVDDVINKMRALKEIGVHFSIDDFGTGYSSLSYLKRFPLDQIKIDKSFVDDIGNDHNNQVLIETIIAMTERMGFSIIAEGVETDEQLNFLKQKGCHFYQGFYFNRPMPVDEFNKQY